MYTICRFLWLKFGFPITFFYWTDLHDIDYIINKYLPEDYAKQHFFFLQFSALFSISNLWFFRRLSFSCVHNRTPREETFGTFSCVHNPTRARKILKNQQKPPPDFEMNFRPLKKHFFVKMTLPKIFPFTGNNMTLSCFLKNNCYTDLQFIFFFVLELSQICAYLKFILQFTKSNY